MQERRHDEAICGLEVRYNLCAITQSVCGIRNACLLFQNAVRHERRADPAVRERVVSPLNKSQSVHVDDLFNVNDARTLLFYSSMHAREAVAARGRIAAASYPRWALASMTDLGTPEELAADVAEDKQTIALLILRG